MTGLLIFVFVFLLFGVPFIQYVNRLEVEQKEKFRIETSEEEETYALVGRADRPRPKGKHCPLHNWSWDEINNRNVCTWCNKTPSQIFNENGGG